MSNEHIDIIRGIINTLVENNWKYIPSENLDRSEKDVMVEPMVRSALMRQKTEVANAAAETDDIICKLKALFSSTHAENLLSQNEAFKQLALDENLFNTKNGGNPDSNQYIVTDNWTYLNKENSTQLDIVLLINGFPVAIGEIKEVTRPSITWLDAAQTINSYERYIPQMFVANIFSFATAGNEYRYAATCTPAARWIPWRVGKDKSIESQDAVCSSINDMITPCKTIDLFQFFTPYIEDNSHNKSKFIARSHQYECANMIAERVRNGHPRKGLIWQSTGSGKTYTMLFAVLKLCQLPDFKKPTIIIVLDRLDLTSQITNRFRSAGILNLSCVATKEQLCSALRQDACNVITTTFSCFHGVDTELTPRDNVIIMADECNNSLVELFGKRIKTALPNAFFFGMTGTPINPDTKKSLSIFIADEDKDYMYKYSFLDATHDGITLPLNFESVSPNLWIKGGTIEQELNMSENDLQSSDEFEITDREMQFILRDRNRIYAVCKSIAAHFMGKIKPNGYTAMVIVYDRKCCLEYKNELDILLGNDCSTIIMTTNDSDPEEYMVYHRSEDETKAVLDRFMDPNDHLEIIITSSILHANFEYLDLQTIYLDKPMGTNEILQLAGLTNRTYDEGKTSGLIVDYIGVFDNIDKLPDFSDINIKKSVSDIDNIRKMFPAILRKCLSYFMGIDRTADEAESLDTAMSYIPTDNEKDMFALDYQELNQAWNILYPDPVLDPLQSDYIWLTRIYEAAKPTDGSGGLVWKSLGKKTQQLLL